MLAYELYLKNKDFKGRIVKQTKPIKKIYVIDNDITIDPKEQEAYGSKISSDVLTAFMQRWLSMPLNTSDAELLNLPDKRTGANSRPPYVLFYGTFEKTRSALRLSVNGKNESNDKIVFTAELDLNEIKETYDASGNIILKIDRGSYQIDNASLFSKYVTSKVINDMSVLSANRFIEISKKFFEYAKLKSLPEEIKKSGMVPFEIFVLPSNGKISYIEENGLENDKHTEKFIDCFGNKCSGFPSTPSQTFKSMSFDDPAFSLNCREKEHFYKDLYIGKESLDKINIPADCVFQISGLYWIFTNLLEPSFEFKRTSMGIYTQLYNNYSMLKYRSGAGEQEQIQMKIICFSKQQAKIEILLDENLTMERMKNIFKKEYQSSDIPLNALEILIDKIRKGNKTVILWNYYLNAIHSLITGTKLDRHQLIVFLTKSLRSQSKIFTWLRTGIHDEPRDFFERSEFCMKNLLVSEKDNNFMNSGEKYAYSVGLIVGRYIRFKKQSKEESNSLRDILAYSKYDRDRLRYIISRICQGVNLSKADDMDIDNMSKFIKENQPEEEISDNESRNDFSYFFYKGAFKELGSEVKI